MVQVYVVSWEYYGSLHSNLHSIMVQVYVLRKLLIFSFFRNLHSIMVQVYGSRIWTYDLLLRIYIPLWFKSMYTSHSSTKLKTQFTFHYGSSLCELQNKARQYIVTFTFHYGSSLWIAQEHSVNAGLDLHSIMVQVYVKKTQHNRLLNLYLHSIMVQVYAIVIYVTNILILIYIPLWFKSMSKRI